MSPVCVFTFFNKESFMKVLKLLLLLFLFSNLHAALLDSDDFTTSLNDWSGNDVTRDSSENWMDIPRDETATKTYSLGISNANTTVTVYFEYNVPNPWEDSDDINVYINDTLTQTYHNNGGDGSESFTTTTDSNGDLKIAFNPDSSADNEPLYIKLVTISDFISPGGFTCANPKTFTSIFTEHAYGKLVQIGNTSLCENDGSGGCSNPGSSTNNNIDMAHYDYDDIDGTSDNNTTLVNSSAALLDIPSGKRVLFAGLFWQGYMVNWTDIQKEAGKTIKYKHANDSYQTVTDAAMNWVYFNASRFYYQSYVDITSYVNTNGPGYYWVGDIATTEGQPQGGSFGAWSLVVVYEDFNEDFKNMTVFHGYQAFAGSGDINDAVAYATANGCATTNTGVGNSVSSTLTGFFTPQDGVVDSSLHVFAGEGDIGLTGDSGTLTDKAGTEQDLSNALNPATNIMNATISKDGATVTTGKPHISANSLGADIDTYDVSSILGNEQSTTDVKFSTSGDGYMPGMYALETQLYVPQFCYDYSYQQLNTFFTENNDGTQAPRISGTVATNQDINVSIYIRNQVDSDIDVTDMYISISDINTTQASYISESTSISRIGNLSPSHIDDSSLNIGSDYIDNISIGTMDAEDYIYVYYGLNPSQTTMDMPLNVEATYNLTIGGVVIPYTLKLSQQIPLCTNLDFQYEPAKSIFNVVHNNYYDFDLGGSNAYYNLPTQVTKREGNFKVVAFDPDNLDTPKNVSTAVAVEIIDAAAFHDTNASCTEPSSAITPRVWVYFENNSTNTMFTQDTLIAAAARANAKALGTGTTSELPTSADFYKVAKQNAAFRVSYNAADDNGSIIEYEKNGDDYVMINFPQLVQDVGTCRQTVAYPLNSNAGYGTTDRVAVACGNSGNQGITQAHFDACNECIYGYDTRFICSRDNFTIRPEALLMHIDDQNQTSPASQTRLTTGFSGLSGATPSVIDLAAEYDYSLKVTGVTHIDNNPSEGYTKVYNAIDGDDAQYIWEARSGVSAGACNENNETTAASFVDGNMDINSSITQVGEYQLSMTDRSWTTVDNDPSSSSMGHHNDINHYTGNADCIQNVATTQAVTTSTTITLTPLIGCEVRSNHTNNVNSYIYNDYDVTFHPYAFNMSAITPTLGINNSALTPTSFIYMSDLNVSDAMAYHINGPINAVGYGGTTLENFVDGCYAKQISLTLNKSAVSGAVAHQFTFRNTDGIGTDINVTDMNSTVGVINLSTNDFNQTNNGQVNTNLNLNFEREQTQFVNPERVTFSTYTSACTTPSQCAMNADLTIVNTDGNVTLNNNLTHFYGKAHAGRKRYEIGTDGPPYPANIYFEVFCFGTIGTSTCDPSLLPSTQRTDDSRWYVNTNHNASRDGLIQGIDQVDGLSVVTATTPSTANSSPAVTNLTLNPVSPYKTTMDINASKWLIYNKYDATTDVNQFPVEFNPAATGWSGEADISTTTKDPGSFKTNRRSMW